MDHALTLAWPEHMAEWKYLDSWSGRSWGSQVWVSSSANLLCMWARWFIPQCTKEFKWAPVCKLGSINRLVISDEEWWSTIAALQNREVWFNHTLHPRIVNGYQLTSWKGKNRLAVSEPWWLTIATLQTIVVWPNWQIKEMVFLECLQAYHTHSLLRRHLSDIRDGSPYMPILHAGLQFCWCLSSILPYLSLTLAATNS